MFISGNLIDATNLHTFQFHRNIWSFNFHMNTRLKNNGTIAACNIVWNEEQTWLKWENFHSKTLPLYNRASILRKNTQTHIPNIEHRRMECIMQKGSAWCRSMHVQHISRFCCWRLNNSMSRQPWAICYMCLFKCVAGKQQKQPTTRTTATKMLVNFSKSHFSHSIV